MTKDISSLHTSLFELEVKHTKYGKKITIIKVNGSVDNVKELARELKKKLGAGGTVKNGVIEIQGDHRRRLDDIKTIITKHTT